jgi:hypothetical protein
VGTVAGNRPVQPSPQKPAKLGPILRICTVGTVGTVKTPQILLCPLTRKVTATMASISKAQVSVFDSPALDLLCELEDAANESGVVLTATVREGDRIHLAPKSILTPDRIARVQTHRDALRLLIQICDDGVQARRSAFARQVAAAGTATVLPALRFVSRVTQAEGVCVSCGDATDAPSWCWRCQLAARLAAHGTVPVDWVPVSRQLVAVTA